MRKQKELKYTKYSIAEDLAPETYQRPERLQKIKNLAIMDKCWSVDGIIKYIQNEESTIKITKNEKDIESLLAEART